MGKRYLTLLATIAAMAACGRPNDPVVAPAAEAELWQTACMRKMSPVLEKEASQLSKLLPPADGIDWSIFIHFEGGKAEIELGPVPEPSVRGGGGKYAFDCETEVLTLIEPYR